MIFTQILAISVTATAWNISQDYFHVNNHAVRPINFAIGVKNDCQQTGWYWTGRMKFLTYIVLAQWS